MPGNAALKLFRRHIVGQWRNMTWYNTTYPQTTNVSTNKFMAARRGHDHIGQFSSQSFLDLHLFDPIGSKYYDNY